ncbi:MAG TPA: hypothetical protein DEB17_04620 [Chlorobaculum sp.]|uniref:Uncharacterized protein n=1 Tax=Chlorobaculum tepidum (strain ATCC 49652 / DSM 12025 / NBRC 103806 / TLS) TaxID=194439 RepID=Q8KB40_CHLTE|nr:hypothetical protein [Chlorobaculum tepidum]AAM73173.1 hypothetical protein CT1954 [Chlorobaculum tepidum TLS]HBU23267.1 hypothetical protein [Chlorobaculum sp.]
MKRVKDQESGGAGRLWRAWKAVKAVMISGVIRNGNNVIGLKNKGNRYLAGFFQVGFIGW